MSLAAPMNPIARAAAGASSHWAVWTPPLAALAVFALTLFAPQVLNDGDTWSHLATGDWILAHGAVPSVDPFSFTMAGAPWSAHEWLAELLLALAFRAAGWSGVVLLTAAAAAAAVLILTRRVARNLEGPALLATTLLGVSLLSPSLLARPHVLALPILAAWASGLMAAREADRAPSLFLLPLMVLWANLHGGFAFGLALIAPFAIEATLAAPQSGRLAVIRDWSLFALPAVGAALLNPRGLEGLLFPVRLLGMAGLSNIGEWQPASFSHLEPLEVGLLGLLGLALVKPVRVPLVRLALLIGLAHLSLQHGRHQMLLGMIAPMLLAAPIARAIGQEAAPAGETNRYRPAILTTAALAVALAAVRIVWPIVRVDGPTAPIAALDAVPAAMRERPVLNGYAFGGYLIWAHVRPFIDGRADMFGDEFLALYGRLTAPDPAALDDVLAHYAIAWTIFPRGAGVAAIMDREPGWRRLYADSFAVVHVRDDAPAQPAAGDHAGE
jgi:hypothetical protein